MDALPRQHKIPTVTIGLDYARLSRDRKKLSENVTIQHQENLAFIEDQGWEYGGSYKDNDISASEFGTKTRDDYWRMVEDIKNWPDRDTAEIWLVIVVVEIPRLYRQLEELLDLIKMAETTKLKGIWTTDGEGYDLSTPEGYHRAVGAVNNARLETKRASKRQLRKKKIYAAQGRYLGGQRRYGFEGPIKDQQGNIINRDRINVAEVPEEIANWRGWYDRLLAGETQSSIIHDNNARGIPSPKGGKWTVGNFRRLMTQEAYVVFEDDDHPADCPCLRNAPGNGTLYHETSGQRHRAVWRGLLTLQERNVLDSVLSAQSQTWRHGMVDGRKYLLSGLIHCGGTYNGKPCGAPMYGNGRQLPSGTYQRRYRCKPHDNHLERVACGKVFRGAEPLDLFVIEAVLDRLDTPEVARLLTPEDDRDAVDELSRKILAQRKRRDLIADQYARGEIESLKEYKRMCAAAASELEKLESQRGRLRSASAARLLPTGRQLREVWDNANLEWRRSVIQLVVERITVHPSKTTGPLWNGYRFRPEDVEIVWREVAVAEVAASLSVLCRATRPASVLAA
jgi:site-specific DNA recombinase